MMASRGGFSPNLVENLLKYSKAAPQWWKLLEWNLCVAVNKQLFSGSLYDTNCGLSSGTNEVGHESEWVIIGKLMSIHITHNRSWGQHCWNQNQYHYQNYHYYHYNHHPYYLDRCHYFNHHHHHIEWNLIGDLMSICLVQQGAELKSKSVS